MKIKKIKTLKYPSLELRINKLYRKKKTFNPQIEIKLTEILLNKIANIIYLYHVTGKTILFLGFPASFEKSIKMTKHLVVPEFLWQNNMFNSNGNSVNKKVRTPKNILKLKTKLRKKVDLIIINNIEKNQIAFRESYFARIPAVVFARTFEVTDVKASYNSVSSYNLFAEKKENLNFFFTFIRSVLLRAKSYSTKGFKKRFPQQRTKSFSK